MSYQIFFRKMKLKNIFIAFSVLLGAASMNAQEFFSTEDAPKFFTLGARVGFNTSNTTFNSNIFNKGNKFSWGTGFDIGAVANLNFKDYLAIQPGIFFQSRSGDYAYATDYISILGNKETFFHMGHYRTYNLNIPIMAIIRFNISEHLRWNMEAGPYFQFKIGDSGLDKIVYLQRPPLSEDYEQYRPDYNSFDVGLKLGTALNIYENYYVGIHYLAGLRNAWSMPKGGHNKSWTFTIGYDF